MLLLLIVKFVVEKAENPEPQERRKCNRTLGCGENQGQQKSKENWKERHFSWK